MPGLTGPAAPQHHRRPGRPPADEQRDRHRSGSPSTARSTIMPRSVRRSNRPGTAIKRAPTPKPSCTLSSSTVRSACICFTACSPSPSGTRRRRRLFCARDRLGIKPFYYYWDGRLFAFASEIKALLEHPAISPALAEDLLPEVLAFGYSSGDRTLFRNIHKLMPGHRLRAGLRRSRSRTHESSATGTSRSRGSVRDLDSATGSPKLAGAWNNPSKCI